MKRVIKAVVAVAAFGLAAAICAPAQARSRDILDGPGGAGEVSMAVGGLTGGLVDGRDVLVALTDDQGLLVALRGDRDRLSGRTAARRAYDVDGLLGTVSDGVEELVGVSVDGLASGGSTAGVFTGDGPLPETVRGARTLTDGLGGLTTTTTRTIDTARISAGAVEGLAEKRSEAGGLVDAVNRAVPQGTERAGTLAPLVGVLSPAEAAPVAGAVAPIVRSASVDELAPLVGNTTGEGARAATGAVDSVADATMGVTRHAAE
ncbi:hypothetical protein ACQPYK_45700 [Streptosporangium sp. CA-135522]|uniref:hypothetical protein n=1 Tax=Streptosporangium sp. CA-135522 TaxID=3240072 RepID=UPI003D8E5191